MLTVGIIPDGNGRWAQNRGLSRAEGHAAGLNALTNLLIHLARNRSNDVESIVIYCFSCENWARPKSEVEAIFGLVTQAMKEYSESLKEYNVRLIHLGRKDRISEECLAAITEAENKTKSNTGMLVAFCIDYSSMWELDDAIEYIKTNNLTQSSIGSQCSNNPETPGSVVTKNLQSYRKGVIKPFDLVVRTSGESRLSNFCLVQSAYAELIFESCHWPDFTPNQFDQTLLCYQSRHRRFGNIQ